MWRGFEVSECVLVFMYCTTALTLIFLHLLWIIRMKKCIEFEYDQNACSLNMNIQFVM